MNQFFVGKMRASTVMTSDVTPESRMNKSKQNVDDFSSQLRLRISHESHRVVVACSRSSRFVFVLTIRMKYKRNVAFVSSHLFRSLLFLLRDYNNNTRYKLIHMCCFFFITKTFSYRIGGNELNITEGSI